MYLSYNVVVMMIIRRQMWLLIVLLVISMQVMLSQLLDSILLLGYLAALIQILTTSLSSLPNILLALKHRTNSFNPYSLFIMLPNNFAWVLIAIHYNDYIILIPNLYDTLISFFSFILYLYF